MTEPIKQEIISCIYENGENLITGPVLQEVLLDMVDDTNAKISSSVGDVVTLITEVSESALRPEDLEGYATEQWVEEQGYLKEVPEGYATTESLNQLSESVSASISSIPSVDLSGYATTQSVNEATESIKEWVEDKHYLTTASLSGSVTEESVRFMINDSTASMKEWVESQSYATETFVSESIASLDIPSIEGLATTESLNELSESVANDFANLDIPDTSGFVTTQSYNLDSASFDERINAITGSDLSGYATTESLNQLSESVASDSASFNERISSIVVPDLSGYATTESLNQVSESVASDITSLSESVAAITGSDLSGYVTTASYNQDSASFDQRINSLSGSEGNYLPLTGGALQDPDSDWTKLEIHSPDDEGGYIELAAGNSPENPDLPSDGLGTLYLGGISRSLAITSRGDFELSWGGNEEEGTAFLEIPKIDREDVIAVRGDLTQLSQSLSASIAAITGSEVDLSGYATTASVNALSSSVNNTFNQYATTQSITQLSQSISQSISNISGSGGDLSALADPSDPDNPVFLALATASIAKWDMDYHGGEWRINVPLEGEVEGEATSFWDLADVISPLQMHLLEAGIWKAEFFYNEGQNTTWWTINTQECLSDTSWNENQVGKFLQSLGLADWEDFQDGGGQWYSTEPGYFTDASASFDQRINSITASGQDTVLREYLFGTGSLLTDGAIYPSASSNWVWEVSESRIFPLGAEVGEGKSIQVIVHNVGADEVEISFNDEYWGPYSVVNGALGSGSFTVKAGEYGDVVATQIGDKIYFRTSVDLSNIEVDLSGYATTASVDALSESVASTFNTYVTTQSFNQVSESFDQRITSCSNLQSFLFGVESCSVDALDCTVTNLYCSESTNKTVGFVSVPQEGRSIAVDIQNLATGSITISLPDSYIVGQTTYTAITNGIGNVATQSLTIPSGQHGNLVIMRRNTDLFFRTSIILTDYEAVFSRLASLEARVDALESGSNA